MNTILVPTDFSPSADNAAHFAAHIALQTSARLMLIHVYQIPVTMNDMPVMVLSADELKQSADGQLARQQEQLQARFPQVAVMVESRLGNVNDELEDVCRELQPLMLVLGSHGAGGFERMLFGSTTASVIRHVWIPVIAVPTNYTKTSLKKIVLAADLLDIKKIPTQKIIDLTLQLGATLDLVHVSGSSNIPDDVAQQLVQKLQPLQPAYHFVQHQNVKDGLLQYLQKSDADLLMVLPHEHSLVERLFFKLHTDDIVRHAPVPVMAIRC